MNGLFRAKNLSKSLEQRKGIEKNYAAFKKEKDIIRRFSEACKALKDSFRVTKTSIEIITCYF